MELKTSPTYKEVGLTSVGLHCGKMVAPYYLLKNPENFVLELENFMVNLISVNTNPYQLNGKKIRVKFM